MASLRFGESFVFGPFYGQAHPLQLPIARILPPRCPVLPGEVDSLTRQMPARAVLLIPGLGGELGGYFPVRISVQQIAQVEDHWFAWSSESSETRDKLFEGRVRLGEAPREEA